MNYGNTPLRAILKTATAGSFSVSADGRAGRQMTMPSMAPSERPEPSVGLRAQAPVALSRALDVRAPPAQPVAPPEPAVAAPPKPSDLAVASLARQIARQSNFRPVGRGDFTDVGAAQRFMQRNPRFTELARARLIK